MINILNKWGLLIQINEEGELIDGTTGGLSIRKQLSHKSEEWIYLDKREMRELFIGLAEYFEQS